MNQGVHFVRWYSDTQLFWYSVEALLQGAQRTEERRTLQLRGSEDVPSFSFCCRAMLPWCVYTKKSAGHARRGRGHGYVGFYSALTAVRIPGTIPGGYPEYPDQTSGGLLTVEVVHGVLRGEHRKARGLAPGPGCCSARL